jgi:hypothetical protein
MAAKARGRGRGKERTTTLMAPATTSTTIVGAPWLGPPTIPGLAPSRCGQGCTLYSSSRHVHHNTPYSLHRHTRGVGDSTLPGPFYLNNVVITPDIIQNLLSIYHFTTDNWYSMEFDPFGLSVKVFSTLNMITR